MEKKNKTHMYRQIYLQIKMDWSSKKNGSIGLFFYQKTKQTTKNRQRANGVGVSENTKQIIIFLL